MPETESVPVVLESSIGEDVAALLVAGSETESVPVVVESSFGEHACAFLVAASENESVPVVLESSFKEDASLAGSGTVSSSGGLCPGNGFSLKKEKGKVLVDQAQFVLSPSQAAELDVDDGDSPLLLAPQW